MRVVVGVVGRLSVIALINFEFFAGGRGMDEFEVLLPVAPTPQ